MFPVFGRRALAQTHGGKRCPIHVSVCPPAVPALPRPERREKLVQGFIMVSVARRGTDEDKAKPRVELLDKYLEKPCCQCFCVPEAAVEGQSLQRLTMAPQTSLSSDACLPTRMRR